MDAERHVFRFFVAAVGDEGAVVELDELDAQHARVLLRGHADDPVEIVDGDGTVFHGTFDGPHGKVRLGERVRGAQLEPTIVLYAFVRVGGRIDELVDGAVQAGATRIVPVVASTKDRDKVNQRWERLTRITRTAAKQSKRAAVPIVTEAISVEELRESGPGIVVVPGAERLLDEVVREVSGVGLVRLLVGSADGFPAGLVEQLLAAGWWDARLGSSILRSELAAAVAVAITAMHVDA